LKVADEELRKDLKVSSFNQKRPRYRASLSRLLFRQIVPGLSPAIDEVRFSGRIQHSNHPALEYAKSRWPYGRKSLKWLKMWLLRLDSNQQPSG
jgi:hypothetical protein